LKVEIDRSVISGRIEAPESKSLAIRYVLLSLLTQVELEGLTPSDDVKAAMEAVNRLKRGERELYLGGSATTLRMIIPIVAALGTEVKLDGDETFRRRPLESIRRALKEVYISSERLPLVVKGKLGEETVIEGWESSQYVSGLIYAYCLKGEGRIRVIPPVSSRGYIHMTADVIRSVGGEVKIEGTEVWVRCGSLRNFRGKVPGDYALASFYANAALLTGGRVEITNLYPVPDYVGDHVIVDQLSRIGGKSSVAEGTWIVEASGTYFPLEVDINDVPDLAPSLAAVMAVSNGRSKLLNVERLRTKESDRISTIISTLRSFGIDAEYHPGEILVNGGEPRWGEVVCPRDHRIAMLAGDLALRAGGRVLDAECVNKSNPKYWEDLMKLGGKVTTS